MNTAHTPRRKPVSAAHAELGRELRRVREAAGKTTRDIEGFSSGHISNAENGHVMPSIGLIDIYVGFGGDRVRLRALHDAARRATDSLRRNRWQQATPDDFEPITPDSPPELIRASYYIEDSEAIYLIDGRGVIREHDAIYRIRAVAQPAPFFAGHRIYYSDTRPSALQVTAGTGCHVIRTAHGLTGADYILLGLTTPALPDAPAPVTLSFNVKVDSEVPAVPMLRYSAGANTARRAVRVKFTAPALPERIWWFRSSRSGGWAETDPASHQILAASESGFYFHEFHELHNEYCGLAWDWRGPLPSDL